MRRAKLSGVNRLVHDLDWLLNEGEEPDPHREPGREAPH
jgi:hypothetical protein